jgi:hypothetical protein
LALAVLQWCLVLDRSSAAIWQWYKFKGYPGGEGLGFITVSRDMQIIFVFGSVVAFVINFLLARIEPRIQKFWCTVRVLTAWSLALGTILWCGFLASPVVKIH